MESGTLNRSTSSTCSNEHSSRSHLIFQIFLSGQGDSCSQFSKISLIDLAGSERVGKSKVEDEKLKESIHINKSLSALSDVLQAKFNKFNHVPFRNSTLTYLLKDDLCGDSKVSVILQIS
jgi:hypothetical protein